MDRDHHHGKLSKKVTAKTTKERSKRSKQEKFPAVFVDRDADFESIRLGPGVEANCYLKDGIVFSEDAKGRVIEIQIVNLSLTTKPPPSKTLSKRSRKAV
jgi:hypothetical protein